MTPALADRRLGARSGCGGDGDPDFGVPSTFGLPGLATEPAGLLQNCQRCVRMPEPMRREPEPDVSPCAEHDVVDRRVRLTGCLSPARRR
jgi:hypothetical protein